MRESIQAGAILIREGTPMPGTLRFESELCLPGWRIVKHLDGHGLDRKIREAGWTFFCQAGETNATVFGLDKEKMVRRAMERILAERRSGAFNSLEIVRVASESSKRFLGVGYVSISAQSRHIQESMMLFRGTGHPSGTEPGSLPPEQRQRERQGQETGSDAKDRAAGAAA